VSPRTSVQEESAGVPAAVAFWVYKRCFSPLLHAVAPGGCRYLPSCSEYAYTALVRFGVLRGSWLTLKRLLRCHPWAAGGLDPVPNRLSGPAG
jgi:hypothetical protein